MIMKAETLGRLYLWQVAFRRIISLLELKQRIDRFYNSGKPKAITELYDRERKRLKVGLRLEGEVLNNFEDKHGTIFPDIHDIQLFDELITEEVIIKFCTIYNPGYGKPGVIANNAQKFSGPILNEIISKAFSGEVKANFHNFMEKAKTYRDQVGAHFDQEGFNMKHGNKKPYDDGIIYQVDWNTALQTFDWEFLNETIPLLHKALNDYIKILRTED